MPLSVCVPHIQTHETLYTPYQRVHRDSYFFVHRLCLIFCSPIDDPPHRFTDQEVITMSHQPKFNRLRTVEVNLAELRIQLCAEHAPSHNFYRAFVNIYVTNDLQCTLFTRDATYEKNVINMLFDFQADFYRAPQHDWTDILERIQDVCINNLGFSRKP